MRKNYYENSQMKKKIRTAGILRLAFCSLLSVVLFISPGCSSGTDDFVLTHKGQLMDGPVRGLDYVSGGEAGVTDENGMFTFERGENITFKLGSIPIGETVPVVSGLDQGDALPDVWVFTPRKLVSEAKNNQDPVVTNILRFLQTLDDDYSFSDGVDNAANGIYISDTARKNAETLKLSLDFKLDESEFDIAAENVISSLTGQYRKLIPALSAQHHFMAQLIQYEVDNTINRYSSPGVTMSMETPCPCTQGDMECINNGVLDGIVRYDSDAHAYIWDFAAGYADVENRRPMTINTRFRICSLTKSFVAMAILKLVQEGLIDYNDLVNTHLPEPVRTTFNSVMNIPSPTGADSPTYADAITIARVMNHSAGLPNFYEDPSPWFLDLLFSPEKQWDLSELVEEDLLKGPAFYPGMGWEYSNTGYALLGLMIEGVTGESWEQAVGERIIEPLGLADTLIPEAGEASIMGPYASDTVETQDYAYGYVSLYGLTGGIYGEEADSMVKRDVQDPSFFHSAGSMISTSPSLRSWIKLIANTGNEEGLFGADFDWLHDDNIYNNLFFKLNENLKVGVNVYHNTYNQQYIISGNSTGYDVNATCDTPSHIALGACTNRTFESTSLPESSGPDIWSFEEAESVQIKDILVFNVLDIMTH